IRKIQRLRIHFAVHYERTELPEFYGIRIRSRQDRFMGVLTRTHVVVMVGRHVDGRRRWGWVRASAGAAGRQTAASLKQPRRQEKAWDGKRTIRWIIARHRFTRRFVHSGLSPLGDRGMRPSFAYSCVFAFVTVQGSDPPSEQRGCSNLAAMAAYRFREVTQHVTLLPLAGLGDRE